MTKEELEIEAEEYIKANNLEWELECHRTSPIGEVEQAYQKGAEPREKRIAELEKENVELIGKIAFLENDLNNAKAQIEKMKRCSICKYSTDLGYCKIRCNGGECNKMDKWEIKEND